MKRPEIHEYAMRLAEVAATRSEDPYCKVGAVALTPDNRVIATAYNGLPSGFTASNGFWQNRDERGKYMIHAEQNLCALFQRGEADKVAVTMLPCGYCLRTLIAHGIKLIWFREYYERDRSAIEVASLFGTELIHLNENYETKVVKE